MQHPPSTGHNSSSSTTNDATTTAVPTLKVMRLQKPELDVAKAGTLKSSGCLLGSSLCLPDSFGVIHVGETFTAYLGALNVSKRLPVTSLTITAQLQTPSQRFHMASKTLDECNAKGGCVLQPEQGIDSIVSQTLEEAGQHILRVEVGYGGTGGTIKSLRKFYRFQVSNPLVISEITHRSGELSCFSSIMLQNSSNDSKGGLTVSSADFEAAPGFISENISRRSPNSTTTNAKETTSIIRIGTKNISLPRGVDLFDRSGRLERGNSMQYLFKITKSTTQPTPRSFVKGITAGDQLGKVVFTWRKACGEFGRMASFPLPCPATNPLPDLNDPGRTSKKNTTMPSTPDLMLPVTIEPINPPKEVHVGIPFDVEFKVVNRSHQFISAQLLFRLEQMKGVSVCGPSSKNLEEIPGNGGNASVLFRFIALTSGLVQLAGCYVMNLATEQTMRQPPLLNLMVIVE